MKPKLTFLLSIIFLFLFSNSVYGKDSDLETLWENTRGIWACKSLYSTYIKNGKDISEKILKKDSDLSFMKIEGDIISFSDKSGKWDKIYQIRWDVSELTTKSTRLNFNFNFRTKKFLRVWVDNFSEPQIYSGMGTCEKIENQFKYLSPN
jgi:hypothetical protein